MAVLEALAELAFIEYSWEACVKFLTSGISGESIGGSGVFRPDRLVWAAETDDLATPRLLAKAAEMQRELR